MTRNVIIVGSGPSGFGAAIYLSRAGLAPLLFTGTTIGGQLTFTTDVENFPGFPDGILGPKLMMDMRSQAQRFGTEIIDSGVSKVDFSKRPFTVWQDGNLFQAESIVISTGADAVMLNLTREKELLGRGVSTCAVCDAAFYRGKTVYVVGGGDAAMEDALALTHFADQIFVIVRKDQLKASKIMQQRVLSNSKVTMLWNTEVTEILGEAKVTHLRLLNNRTKETKLVPADGLFYAIGHMPNSKLIENKIKTDEKGYILTPLNGLSLYGEGYDVWRDKYPTMTSVEGVFAAGDVVDFRYRQAITASAFGVMAALDVEKWLGRQVKA